jgi:hypothetical protein
MVSKMYLAFIPKHQSLWVVARRCPYGSGRLEQHSAGRRCTALAVKFMPASSDGYTVIEQESAKIGKTTKQV